MPTPPRYIRIRKFGFAIFLTILVVLASSIVYGVLSIRTTTGNAHTTAAVGVLFPPPVPSNAAYLGAWVNPQKATESGEAGSKEIAQLAEFNSSIGKPVAILHVYTGFTEDLPFTTLSSIDKNGSIPLVNWSCTHLSDITSGKDDAIITAYAQSLKTFGKPVFLRWYWEMNSDNENRANNGCDAYGNGANYIAAWQHIWNIFHQVGATNVAFIWCPSKARGLDASPYYPGDTYVDWIGVDSYNHQRHNPHAFEVIFGDFYNQWVSHNKPIMIVETGALPADQEQYLQEVQNVMPEKYPQIKAFIYFDSDGNLGDWSLQKEGLAAFKDLAHTPYFSFTGK